MVHGCCELRPLTVSVLVSGILLVAASASTGCMCKVWHSLQGSTSTCPAWLHQAEDWQWPLFGGFLWAVLTGASAWRQLDQLASWERTNFWRSEISGMMYPEQSSRLLYHAGQNGEESPRGDPMFRTK